ncbi:hypothetical protein tb265_42480 [Gemmatimonadetes bacterium T265]|nr:hypothetical protein tb265_42480 [Gemmatimonadetes bacterium T265]
MRDFRNTVRTALAAAAATGLLGAAAAPAARAQTTQPAPKHHSKLKGAIVGGVAGAAVGHPKTGAAAGVLYQHHKNKKAAAG